MAPEMTKSNRPVIILTSSMQGRQSLVTVVALSTVEPDPIMDWHMKLPDRFLPMTPQFANKTSWVKGDMIYSVGFHRLNLIQESRRNPITGKRVYFNDHLGTKTMNKVRACVLRAMQMPDLATHLLASETTKAPEGA